LEAAAEERPDPSVTDEAFREWRSPRFGRSNPERLNNPLWEWLVRSGWSAYAVRKRFVPSNEQCAEAGWCFSRFGQSSTPLADGRTVLIAGEHEDSYDSDFYIYNDVIVRGAGGEIDVYGYPADVFAPTDFHSATLAGDRIVVVGCLGYPAERQPGTTPVAFLDLETFAMSRAESTGAAPGWIHRHEARLSDDGRAVVVRGGKIVRGELGSQELVENADDWRLDLATCRWERLTERRWSQFSVHRSDRRANRLAQMHSLWTFRGARWAAEHRESMETMIRGQVEQLTAEYGVAPDVELFGALYTPSIPHEQIPDVEFGVRRIRVDGTVVRYVEQPHAIQMIVEGDLPSLVVDLLVADLQGKLARIENTAYVVRKL
jgi:hypothetical protein